MLTLRTTCELFGIAFLLHIVVWKIRLPQRQFLTLLVIFGVVFLGWLCVLAARPLPFWDTLHTALFYISTSLCYVVLYSAFNLDSPTLSLMRFIAETRAEGRSAAEVTAFLARRPFVKGRLGQLLTSAAVREENGRYVMAGKGSPGFRFILGYRKLYGSIPKGG